jgi:hypothetical protein
MTAVWITGAVTVVLAVFTLWRIRVEPRRVLHGLLVTATLVALWLTLLAWTWRGDGTGGGTSDASALLFYGTIAVGLLLIIVTGVFLLVNGYLVVRREGLGMATLVPAVFGLLLVGTIIGLIVALLFVSRGAANSVWLLGVVVLLSFPLAVLPVGMLRTRRRPAHPTARRPDRPGDRGVPRPRGVRRVPAAGAVGWEGDR